MTPSARARIDGGTVRPSALAVLKLTISSDSGALTRRESKPVIVIDHFALYALEPLNRCRILFRGGQVWIAGDPAYP